MFDLLSFGGSVRVCYNSYILHTAVTVNLTLCSTTHAFVVSTARHGQRVCTDQTPPTPPPSFYRPLILIAAASWHALRLVVILL